MDSTCSWVLVVHAIFCFEFSLIVPNSTYVQKIFVKIHAGLGLVDL